MQILNVRFGYATNSSSNHSLVFIPQGITAQDYMGMGWDDQPYPIGDFHQQNFTLASDNAKLHYLGVLLRNRFERSLPNNIRQLITRSWLGVDIEEDEEIDHQSVYHLPAEFGTNIPSQEFIEHLKAYFLHENLVILGGNDNEICCHPLDDGNTFNLPIPRDISHSTRFVCRYDVQSDYWTIYNQGDGTRIRFRLTPGSKDFGVVPKASAPEMVDLKITDCCHSGCQFCYQNSTPEGKHADYYSMYSIVQALAGLKVFEVAIGGGEPTLHPKFIEILKDFREAGIIPNFSTKNLEWLRDPSRWSEIMQTCGAFGFSVNDPREIHQLKTLLDYNGIHTGRAVVHVVLGTVDHWRFLRIIEACNECQINLLLLGYKETGRGANFAPIPYSWWLSSLKNFMESDDCRLHISIDTTLAEEYKEQLIAANIPNWMLSTRDGSFSCYIDAVEHKVAASSYTSKMVDYAPHGYTVMEQIQAAFASF